jgi:hypothetical protein
MVKPSLSKRTKEMLLQRIKITTLPIRNHLEAARVKNHLETLVRQRETTMIELLGAATLPSPKIRVGFFSLVSDRSEYKLGRITINALDFYRSTNAEIFRTVDHEIAHYVQLSRNRHLSTLQYFPFLFGGRIFTEGFATFASRISTGNTSRMIQIGMNLLLAGQKMPSDLKSYVIGYFRFLAIAKANTADFALNVGLTNSIKEWKTECLYACKSLGIPYI